MQKVTIAAITLALASLLIIAEYVLPNYLSRFVNRLSADLWGTETVPVAKVELPEGATFSNEFAFVFEPIGGAEVKLAAGVIGPNDHDSFETVEQRGDSRFSNAIGEILLALGADFPVAQVGGLKQLVQVENSFFGLLGLQRGDCFFAAIVDLVEVKVLEEFPCIEVSPDYVSMNGVGGGFVVDAEALYLSLGTGSAVSWSAASEAAQSAVSPYGKVLKYRIVQGPDGISLESNGVFSSGHRNIQGMAKIGDTIVAVEHGPKGGDELNIILEGRNYGWPVISAGSQYNDGDLSAFAPEGSRFENPAYTFVPSIAPSDIENCPSIIVQRYAPADCAIISALREQGVYIVVGDFSDKKVWSVEHIDIGVRIREVHLIEDSLFLVPDAASMMKVEISKIPCNEDGPCGNG